MTAEPIRWESKRTRAPVTGCTHPRAHVHRCAECGGVVHVYEFLAPGTGTIPRAVAACQDHPEADVLCWRWRPQAAAIAVCQRAVLIAIRRREEPWITHLEESLEQYADEIADLDVPTRRGDALLSVRSLLQRWRGLPPGRLFPAEQPRDVVRPALY